MAVVNGDDPVPVASFAVVRKVPVFVCNNGGTGDWDGTTEDLGEAVEIGVAAAAGFASGSTEVNGTAAEVDITREARLAMFGGVRTSLPRLLHRTGPESWWHSGLFVISAANSGDVDFTSVCASKFRRFWD